MKENDLTYIGAFQIPTQIHREFSSRCLLRGIGKVEILLTMIRLFGSNEKFSEKVLADRLAELLGGRRARGNENKEKGKKFHSAFDHL
jgi:hypothetical protein